MSFDWPLWMTGAMGAAGAAVTGVVCYGAFWPRSRLFAPVICHGSRDAPARVTLTFDDGPHPDATPAILDALDRIDARATFFVIGAHARRHPDLLRRIDAAGHLVGNHSYDHAYHGMWRLGRYWNDQLQRTEDVIADAIGKRPRLFRPPLGFKQHFIAKAATDRGYAIVTWTRRGRDGWPVKSEQILRRLVGTARGGDILTLHDSHDGHAARNLQPTIDAIEPLGAALRRHSLELERLDKLINVQPYA